MSDEAEYFTKGLDRGKDGRSSPLGAFNLADEKGAAAALAGWQAGQTARAHAEAIREAVETSSDDDDGPSYRYSSSPTSLDNVESGGPWTGIFIFLAVVGALILWVLSFFGVTQEWFHQLTQTVSPNSGRGQVAIEGVCTYKLDQDSNELSIFIPIIRNSYGWAHSGTLSIEAAMTNNPYGGKAMVDEWRSIGQITLSDTLTRDEYYHDIAQTFKLKEPLLPDHTYYLTLALREYQYNGRYVVNHVTFKDSLRTRVKKPWWKIWGGEGSRFVEGKQTSGDEIKDSSTENITPTTVVELPKVVTTFPKAPEEPQSRSALENADNVVTLPKVMRQPADVATPPSEVPPDVAATPTEAPPEIVWHVVNVRADDPHQLNVHSEAGGQSKVIGHIPWDAKNLLVIERAYNGPDLWFLTRYGDNEGWVHSAFVTRD